MVPVGDGGREKHGLAERIGLGRILLSVYDGRMALHQLLAVPLILVGSRRKPEMLLCKPSSLGFFAGKTTAQQWCEDIQFFIIQVNGAMGAIKGDQCQIKNTV